jgi:3',5'-cyclic AMP phosphodiesterase CpdA
MSLLTILHVSDVHFKEKGNAEQRRVTDSLINDAHAHTESFGRFAPDICLFTGDLSQAGTTAQFDAGEHWLQKLVSKWGCKVFVVPGNHDVARPKKGVRKGEVIIRDLRSAHADASTYGKYRNDVVHAAPLLTNFRNWHAAAKSRINLVSDWSASPFACTYDYKLQGTKVALIGLNTALLSCDDEDREKLVADEESFNEALINVNANRDLIVVATHHPIGIERTTNFRWLAKWNAEKLEELLLQATGPHIYLHGHLHEERGTTLGLSTGQSLAFFAAGAAYQNTRYPLRFGFYDIDLLRGVIRPWVYSYNKEKGNWYIDPRHSSTIQAVLPLPKKTWNADADAHIVELKVVLREVIETHVHTQKMLSQRIPLIAPELDSILTPGVRKRLLVEEYDQYQCEPLLDQINRLPPEDQTALQNIRELAEANHLTAIIGLLRSDPARQDLLLTALVLSTEDADWDEAEKLLARMGKPFHYFRLGHGAWSEGNVVKATSLTEKALELAEKKAAHDDTQGEPMAEDGTSLAKIKNNLAYFYAELAVPGKADEAKAFAKDAVKAVEQKKDKELNRYANYLDTLGFVEIAYATSWKELQDGIFNCEEARRLGADRALYFKHIARAEARESDLPAES